MKKPVAALILAAGQGERMNSDLVKVLHPIAGLPLIAHVTQAVRGAGIKNVGVVIGTQGEAPRSFLSGVKIVLQKKQLGTGHAVMQARSRFGNWQGDLLVLPGDVPCVLAETLRELIKAHQRSSVSASILTADFENPTGYGRILRRGNQVVSIKEELDLKPSERGIREINSGIYVFHTPALFRRLNEIKRNRKKKEYYLTDVIELFARNGELVRAYKIKDSSEILGVNTRKELGEAHQVLTERELKKHSQAGVTILDPAQTSIQKGARIGRDTVIHPFTWIERDVTIGRKCEIGPFAKIRAGSKIGDEVVIGSFVEVVRSRVGNKTFVKHLSYLGDARIGQKVNVGAGTITANFDGKRKNKTVVGDRVLLGCDTVLIAPVTVGKGAQTGAGAVLCARNSVPAGKTVVGVPAKVIKRKG
ncbi:MAG: NTP transferase domain-containing protein [Candidatus Omnitrophica bacterium]|nr:NTP transferase domain-containing protein [Candidatus Omnitrophota bacterium]